MVLLHPDGAEVDVNRIVGKGSNGIVLSHSDGRNVLKIPLLHDTSPFKGEDLRHEIRYNKINTQFVEAEKKAYGRLGHLDGIAKCIKSSPEGIVLQNYTKGSLEDFITEKAEPSPNLKIALIAKAIAIVRACHQKSVLLNDIALRNFLVTDDTSIVMIDFGQCKVFESDEGMVKAAGDGWGAEVDIFQLGCVIHSIAAWQKYELEVPDTTPPWPGVEHKEHTMYDDIVGKCLEAGYESMDGVCSDFQLLIANRGIPFVQAWNEGSLLV